MATGKAAKKTDGKKGAEGKKAAPVAADKKARVAASLPLPEARPPLPKKPAGPTARTCPLVLDGEIDAADFSPGDCLTCSEFDCRFCEAEEGSGSLRSRLFAGADDAEEAEDAWGGDPDFGGGEEAGGEEGDDEEDRF